MDTGIDGVPHPTSGMSVRAPSTPGPVGSLEHRERPLLSDLTLDAGERVARFVQ